MSSSKETKPELTRAEKVIMGWIGSAYPVSEEKIITMQTDQLTYADFLHESIGMLIKKGYIEIDPQGRITIPFE